MQMKTEADGYDILLNCYRTPVFKAQGNPGKLATCFKTVSHALDETFYNFDEESFKADVHRVSLAAFIGACKEYYAEAEQSATIIAAVDMRTGLSKISFRFNCNNTINFDLCDGVESDWVH